MSNELQDFLRERNEVLASGDLDKVIAHFVKWSPDKPLPSRHVMEIAMHKARTGCLGLTEEARKASRWWLVERGYSTLDD